MIDANGMTTTYTFDPTTGWPTGTLDALGRDTHVAYDALGRKASETDRMDQVVTYTYDAAGHVLSRTAGGAATTYTYDLAANRLTATAAGRTITSTHDALGRPLSVSTSDDAGATTTYAYSLTSPSWTDPTGTYLVTLDAFDRQASLDDPVTTGVSPTTYRADGQVAAVVRPTTPTATTTTHAYDVAGRLTGLATTNAAFTHTLNRAANRLSENAQVSGDPQNGGATFAFDALGRLATYTPPGGSAVPYGWDEVPNRTSAGGVTTTFDAANRPTSSGFATDLDGRISAIPLLATFAARNPMAYDALGRLTSVTVSGVATTYTYDPLDRLATVSRGGAAVARFRYVGRTTSVAQILDGAGTVTRNIGTDWAGVRFADWGPGGANLRYLGANGHGDLVYTLSSAGAVSATNRLDPWGVPLGTPPSGFPEFRLQGSWYDGATDLAWVIARWYAPRLGTFTSEDSVVGDPTDPPSRHLYAYGAGDPVDRADVSGRHYLRVSRLLVSWENIAEHYYGARSAATILRAKCGNWRCPTLRTCSRLKVLASQPRIRLRGDWLEGAYRLPW